MWSEARADWPLALEIRAGAQFATGMMAEEIDVVLLVGGATLRPYVQERLEQHFGKRPSKKVDPDLAVALGAALCIRDLPWDNKTHRVMLT